MKGCELPPPHPGAFCLHSHGLCPRPAEEVPLPRFALEKVKTGWGFGDLIVSSSFRIQEGRDYFPWKSLERGSPSTSRREGLAPEHDV